MTQSQVSHNGQVNEWVVSWLRRLQATARVLDFASGSGRHAKAAHDLGLQAHAWDSDALALQELAEKTQGGVVTKLADLEAMALPNAEGFDALIVSNYLFRPRLFQLPKLLLPGGLLIYQTFAQGHELIGRPRRADFLLKPLELVQLAEQYGLHVLQFEDGFVNDQHGQAKARIQRMAALRMEGASADTLKAWPVKIDC